MENLMDGSGNNYGGVQFDAQKVGDTAGLKATQICQSSQSLNPIPPATPTTIADLVEAAGIALHRLHGVAETVESFGDKLVGSVPTKGDITATGPGSGSVGQLASLLAMIHATVDRIESGAVRLHNIHG